MRWIAGVVAVLLQVGPAAAQIVDVIHGRVEDAVTREPVSGARVISADSSSSVLTDSLGAFAIPLPPGQPLTLHAERLGYVSQSYQLSDRAPSAISVLLLEPDPIALEGIEVVQDAAVTALLRDLSWRRNFYQGSLAVFDRSRLDRFAIVGSTWDFIRSRYPRLFECGVGSSGVCVPGRGRSFTDPYPEVPVLVCVDGWESWGAVTELDGLDIRSVALVEIYGGGGGGIRVYTPGYLAQAARTGRFIATPLQYGC